MADPGRVWSWFIPAAILSASLTASYGFPAGRWTDTAVVQSSVDEVFVEAPADLMVAATGNAHGRFAGGRDRKNKGYYRKVASKGDDGYQKFDAYHTKNGDQYGFEEHSAFGKNAKNKKYHDGEGAASAPRDDVEILPGMKADLRSQSIGGINDAFKQDGGRHIRKLHDEDGDLFFVFTGDHYTASEGDAEGGGEGEASQNQETHDDESEAQEAPEGEDYEAAQQNQQQQQQEEAADDYDY